MLSSGRPLLDQVDSWARKMTYTHRNSRNGNGRVRGPLDSLVSCNPRYCLIHQNKIQSKTDVRTLVHCKWVRSQGTFLRGKEDTLVKSTSQHVMCTDFTPRASNWSYMYLFYENAFVHENVKLLLCRSEKPATAQINRETTKHDMSSGSVYCSY